MQNRDEIEKIKALFAKGEFESALNSVRILVKDLKLKNLQSPQIIEAEKNLLLISSQFNILKGKDSLGIIERESFQTTQNKILNGFLNILSNIETEEIKKYSNSVSKEMRIQRNLLYNEISFNIDLIFKHYLTRRIPEEIVIDKLKIEEIKKSFEAGFNFNLLKEGTITESIYQEIKSYKHYIGYNCEELITKILNVSIQLKLIPELYDDIHVNSKINIKKRIENLGTRYLILIRFINS
ncbi:MAG: hypothetical protein R2828_34360 [Saprospiraceae bacterium]